MNIAWSRRPLNDGRGPGSPRAERYPKCLFRTGQFADHSTSKPAARHDKNRDISGGKG